eukprot:comp19857_c0_seq1/m.23973 comp19857_c0_seq1/g.23973  ORF comp19857_c0_seq1/g.23973 comp19857_c0_seq1/m.23973 type:complete len:263 (-) comp19857_c0_seq1:193-981(-)
MLTTLSRCRPLLAASRQHLAQHIWKTQPRACAPLPRVFSQPITRHQSTRFNYQSTYTNWWRLQKENKSFLYYTGAIIVFTCAASYAAVPLYRLFCQATGFGGTVQESKNTDLSEVEAVRKRPLRIRFNADTSQSMRWEFRPQQAEIRLVPGESALAFYTAYNPTDEPIIGISTYNVIPFEAGQYFNKIQCFCFEEQRLNPKEQVDMPVFFYIDPEFAQDPQMAKVHTITLSYTFFESKAFDYSKWSAAMPAPQAAAAAPAAA